MFGVMAAISGPDKRREKCVGKVLEKTKGVRGLMGGEGSGTRGVEERGGGKGVMRVGEGEAGGGEEL